MGMGKSRACNCSAPVHRQRRTTALGQPPTTDKKFHPFCLRKSNLKQIEWVPFFLVRKVYLIPIESRA